MWHLGPEAQPQAKVQKLMAVIKFARHAFDGNDSRRYVFVRHLNPGANLCVKSCGLFCERGKCGTWGPRPSHRPNLMAVIKIWKARLRRK